MFLRIVRAPGGNGATYEYVRVVEAYRHNGKTKHRTIINLGRKDLLAEHLDLEKLTRLLHGDPSSDAALQPEDIDTVGAWDWGPLLVARTLWSELGLEATLDSCVISNRRKNTVPLSDRALVLVANRLVAPGSEHGLARWLETDFVCDRRGRRWLPAWREEAERKASKTPRVQVELTQLKQWYRTLDELVSHKDHVERALHVTLRNLFSLQVDMVLYDLTSTYFEGDGPPGLSAHGHSRDAAQQTGAGRRRDGRWLANRAPRF